MQAIVFDLGGTHLRSAIYSAGELKFLVKKRIVNFTSGCSSDSIWAQIVDELLDYEASIRSKVLHSTPIVVSFPGPVTNTGQVLSAPTLAGADLEPPDIRAKLIAATHRPVHIINDLSAAVWHISRTIREDRFIVVTVSSGIGSKVFDRNHPRRVIDDVAYSGEIGHAVVDFSQEAAVCDCGGRGHLGAIASGRGIERFARQTAREDPDTFASSYCVQFLQATVDNLTNEQHLVPAANMHDPWSLAILRERTSYLARALALVTLAFGLERIVVIGGFAVSLGQTYIDILSNELIEIADYHLLKSVVRKLTVLEGTSKETCLLGAGAYAEQLAF